MSQPNLDEWFAQILSKDAKTFEDAYWGDRPPAGKAVPRIMQALNVVWTHILEESFWSCLASVEICPYSQYLKKNWKAQMHRFEIGQTLASKR